MRRAALLLLLGGCAAPGSAGEAPDPELAAAAEATREAARQRGATYRAVGQEPGWLLEIKPGRITAQLDYGERTVHVPAVEPAREGERTVYAAQTEATRLRLEILPQDCRDAMSGQPYADTVSLEVNGRTYRGCGEPLAGERTRR